MTNILKSIKGFVVEVIACIQEAKRIQAQEYTKWHS